MTWNASGDTIVMEARRDYREPPKRLQSIP
jgi:hypothetical protein